MGFTLTFDNVNQKTKTKFHSSDGKGNQQLNLVQSYGVLDRVACHHLSDVTPSAEDLAKIPVETFLQTEDDIDTMR